MRWVDSVFVNHVVDGPKPPLYGARAYVEGVTAHPGAGVGSRPGDVERIGLQDRLRGRLTNCIPVGATVSRTIESLTISETKPALFELRDHALRSIPQGSETGSRRSVGWNCSVSSAPSVATRIPEMRCPTAVRFAEVEFVAAAPAFSKTFPSEVQVEAGR